MPWYNNNPVWRIGFGNPIFVRVVETAAKRNRHALVRIGYLTVLVGATLIMVLVSLSAGGTLTELSRESAKLFTVISFLQLGMACLLAPIFTAGAITQEKDNQTYNVLLATPLSNAQIVLGSLLSRLFFVLALLASGIPIFLITQLFGGVTGQSILLSFMIAAATVVFTGAVAVAIAVVRVGTGKTIFAFYVVIGAYIAAIWMLASFLGPGGGKTCWLTALHPFLSLMVVLNIAHPPGSEAMAGAGWLNRLWLCYPHYAYLFWTLGVSVVMVAMGTIFLRYSNARTRADWRRRLRQWLARGRMVRKPRSVWNNPVAWREAKTRASAGGKSLLRWLFLAGGLVAGAVVLTAYAGGQVFQTTIRDVLATLLWVELSLVVLVLCNVSASAITREREDGTLDLLLVTPITSRYYIWGKLRGLISFAAMLLVVPVGTALMFALHGLARAPVPVMLPGGFRKIPVPIMPIEAVVELAAVMLAFCALTAMIALSMSLRIRRTVGAVIATVGLVGALALFGAVIGVVMAENLAIVGPLLAMVSPYSAIALVTSPHRVGLDTLREMSPPHFRVLVLVYGAIVVVGYVGFVAGLYKSMVKTFDMIVRRQSR